MRGFAVLLLTSVSMVVYTCDMVVSASRKEKKQEKKTYTARQLRDQLGQRLQSLLWQTQEVLECVVSRLKKNTKVQDQQSIGDTLQAVQKDQSWAFHMLDMLFRNDGQLQYNRLQDEIQRAERRLSYWKSYVNT